MKSLVLLLLILAACSCEREKSSDISQLADVSHDEITDLLLKHTSQWSKPIELGGSKRDEYYYNLSNQQFSALAYEFTNELKSQTQSKYGYADFSHRSTKLNEGVSTFVFRIGRSGYYRYLIHGVRTERSDVTPNTVILISETRLGEQDGGEPTANRS